jgi:hypothetical protein
MSQDKVILGSEGVLFRIRNSYNKSVDSGAKTSALHSSLLLKMTAIG